MTDVRGARIVRLLDDPALGGDLLLVAVALAAKYDFGWDYGNSLNTLGARLWPEFAQRGWRIRDVFKRDIRTYRPPTDFKRVCGSPMIRRETPCGMSATSWGYVTDWATGEKSYVGACSRHRAWFNAATDANRALKPDVVPLPCANHGGALAVHFPRVDWRAFWARLDPLWVEHPEQKPWPKPDLQLVLGEGAPGDGATPLLSLVPIGGAS